MNIATATLKSNVKNEEKILIGSFWANIIKEKREMANLTQEEFADRFNLSLKTVQEYEKGVDFPQLVEFQCEVESTILTDFDDIKNEEERETAIREAFMDFVSGMRNSAGLTKVKFAEVVGISLNSVKQYEKGIAFPRNVEEIEICIRRIVKYEIMRKREIMRRQQLLLQLEEEVHTLKKRQVLFKNRQKKRVS